MRSRAAAYDASAGADRDERPGDQIDAPSASVAQREAVSRYLETHSELEFLLAATLGIGLELRCKPKAERARVPVAVRRRGPKGSPGPTDAPRSSRWECEGAGLGHEPGASRAASLSPERLPAIALTP